MPNAKTIFTPRVSFDADTVRQVAVLPGLIGASGPVKARLRVASVVGGSEDFRIFYGAEAVDVLAQLEAAGYYTPTQRSAVEAALRDEIELAGAACAKDDL